MVSSMQTPIIPIGSGQTQELIAPVQDTLIAKQNYAQGQQFILGGALFTVTKSGGISVGDTINMNTDVEASDNITDQIMSMGEKVKYKVVSFDSDSTAVSSITGINILISDPSDATKVLARIPLTASPRDSSSGLTGMWVSAVSSIAVRVIVTGNHAAQQYNTTVLFIYE